MVEIDKWFLSWCLSLFEIYYFCLVKAYEEVMHCIVTVLKIKYIEVGEILIKLTGWWMEIVRGE